MADENQAVAGQAGASPPSGEESANSEKGGGSGKLKLGIIIMVAAIYAGLVVASSLFTQYVVTPKVSSRLIEAEKEKIAESLGSEDDVDPFGTVYVIEDLVVNPAQSAGMRYVCVSVGLESHSPEVIQELELRDAQVKDALITIFGSKSVDELVNVQSREVMRQEIQDRIEEVLPADGLDAVYFVNFVLQ